MNCIKWLPVEGSHLTDTDFRSQLRFPVSITAGYETASADGTYIFSCVSGCGIKPMRDCSENGIAE